jgi:hypothetical protein
MASHVLGQVHDPGSQRVGKGTVVVVGESNISAPHSADSRSVPDGRVVDQGLTIAEGSVGWTLSVQVDGV